MCTSLKILSILIIFNFGAETAQSQNLIPNGNFEEYDSLLIMDTNICSSAPFWAPEVKYWYSANSLGFKYLHSKYNICNSNPAMTNGVPINHDGFEHPHSNESYVLLMTYENSSNDTIASAASIIQIEMPDSLHKYKKYCFSTFISSCDCNTILSDAFGAYFSNTAISSSDVYNFIQYTPQISNPDYRFPSKYGWTLVSGSFIADGGEMYLTIGSFENDFSVHIVEPDTNNTWFCSTIFPYNSAIYIDDVSLYDCTGFYYEAEAGENRELCKGEETTLGWDENTTRTFKWSVVSGDSASLSNDSLPRPTVSPQQTTVYALYVVDEYVQEHFDTVTVEVIDCENPIYLPNIFSPNNDGNNDVYYVRSSYVKELKAMRIYDRWGEEVFSCHTSTPLSVTSEECGWDGTFHGQEAPTGVYAVFVEALLLNGETVTKSGNVTLVR